VVTAEANFDAEPSEELAAQRRARYVRQVRGRASIFVLARRSSPHHVTRPTRQATKSCSPYSTWSTARAVSTPDPALVDTDVASVLYRARLFRCVVPPRLVDVVTDRLLAVSVVTLGEPAMGRCGASGHHGAQPRCSRSMPTTSA
jgi:hypothetical protein